MDVRESEDVRHCASRACMSLSLFSRLFSLLSSIFCLLFLFSGVLIQAAVQTTTVVHSLASQWLRHCRCGCTVGGRGASSGTMSPTIAYKNLWTSLTFDRGASSTLSAECTWVRSTNHLRLNRWSRRRLLSGCATKGLSVSASGRLWRRSTNRG